MEEQDRILKIRSRRIRVRDLFRLSTAFDMAESKHFPSDLRIYHIQNTNRVTQVTSSYFDDQEALKRIYTYQEEEHQTSSDGVQKKIVRPMIKEPREYNNQIKKLMEQEVRIGLYVFPSSVMDHLMEAGVHHTVIAGLWPIFDLPDMPDEEEKNAAA